MSTTYSLKHFCAMGDNLPSTMPGISLLPLTPPNADPFQTRPVTSWNLLLSRFPMSRTIKGRLTVSSKFLPRQGPHR